MEKTGYDFVINCTDGVCDEGQHDYNGYLGRLQAKEHDKESLDKEAEVIFREAMGDVQHYAKFVMSLNHLLWKHYNDGNERVARWYDALWRIYDSFAYRNFKGKELDWYIRYLD